MCNECARFVVMTFYLMFVRVCVCLTVCLSLPHFSTLELEFNASTLKYRDCKQRIENVLYGKTLMNAAV